MDTGCGISSEKRQNLFQMFTNMEFENHINSHGIGLGLTICKRVIGSLHGSIEFKSEINKGRLSILLLTINV